MLNNYWNTLQALALVLVQGQIKRAHPFLKQNNFLLEVTKGLKFNCKEENCTERVNKKNYMLKMSSTSMGYINPSLYK